MADPFPPGPLSPEAIALGLDYYGGVPGGASRMPPAQPLASTADYYGAPPAPAITVAPVALPDAGAAFGMSAPPPAPAPPPQASTPPTGAEALPPALQAALASSLGAPPAPRAPAVKEYEPSMGAFSLSPPKVEKPLVTAAQQAKDDAEFAASMKAHARPASGGRSGGGSPSNRDPYGLGAANAGILGSYDEQAAGMRQQATAEGDRAVTRAESMVIAARHREEDAAIARAEQAQADERFVAMQADAQRQLDDVREQKVDPDRLMRSDGMAVKAMIGGLFGGLYMGMTKGTSNPFIDQLNKQIDRDIAAQEKNIAGARAGVVDQMNLIREQRATWKDAQVARLQARSLAYEATIAGIEAEAAAKYDQPIQQARAKQGIAAIEREKAQVQKALGEEQRRLAAAAAGAGMADLKAKRAAFLDTYDKLIASGAPPATAEAEAYRMIDNLFGAGAAARPAATGAVGGADPLANVPKDQKAEAAKELAAHAEIAKGVQALEQAYASFGDASAGGGGRDAWKASIRGIIKPHVKGANSDADLDMLINPLVPTTGELDGQRRARLAAAKALLQSQGATPILDRASPGWKGPQAPAQYGFDGKPMRR